MDKLRERAVAFNKLVNIEYNIIFGKAGKLTHLTLTFDKKNFHHLIGFKYLEDRRGLLNKDRAKIFDAIINNEITYCQICNSDFFYDIEKRFSAFVDIEHFLDNNGLIFKFNRKAKPAAKMQAKYIMESTANNDTAYMCIDKRDNQSKFFCRSFFPKEYDYTWGHIRHTLLYKEKVNVITREKIVQYDKLTPKKGKKDN